MTEDNRQKEVRLKRELAQLKAVNSSESRAVKKNRDFSVGLPEDTTKKPLPTSSDIPDVISLPPKRRGKTENIPY